MCLDRQLGGMVAVERGRRRRESWLPAIQSQSRPTWIARSAWTSCGEQARCEPPPSWNESPNATTRLGSRRATTAASRISVAVVS